VAAPNGCGAAGGASFPGTGVGGADFTTPCNKHDQCYGTCGSDKATCDQNFLKDLYNQCLAVGGGISLRIASWNLFQGSSELRRRRIRIGARFSMSLARMLQMKILIIAISFLLPLIFLGVAFNYDFSSMRIIYLMVLLWYLMSGFLIVRFEAKCNYWLLALNYIPISGAILFLLYYNLSARFLYEVFIPFVLVIMSVVSAGLFYDRK
jgi:hypothetical protein